jgi:polyhydroxybutyrate depolymerase
LGVTWGLLATGCGNPTQGNLLGLEQKSELFGSELDAAVPRSQKAVLASRGSSIGTRTYQFVVPSGYDPAKPTPLVVLAHGFGASGPLQELYFQFTSLAQSKTFLYAYPDGLQDPLGARYWNATDGCCDFFHSGVDDVAYLGAVIDDMSSKYNVDKKRVFVIGHSNGGFMAHRLACDLSGRVAAVVSLAGAQWKDPTHCLPSEPVAVAEIHGNLDALISYDGGTSYPSAHETVADWANRNRCTGALTYNGDNLDLDLVLPGAETKVERYTGCPEQGPVELWTIEGGSHIPVLTKYFTQAVYSFLSSHPKP